MPKRLICPVSWSEIESRERLETKVTSSAEASTEIRLEILNQQDEVLTDLLRAYYFRGMNGALNSCKQTPNCAGACPQDHHRESGTPRFYSGAGFDLESEQSTYSSDRFTETDLLRMAQLSVPVGGACVSDYYDGYFDQRLEGFDNKSLNQLLKVVSQEVSLDSLGSHDFETHLGRRSPAQQLWNALRASSIGRGWGLGPTRISKLIAAKRPGLVPIYDKWVMEAFGRTNDRFHWTDMRDLFQAQPKLAGRLQRLPIPNTPRISTIRILDVIIWMNGVEARAMKEDGALYRILVAEGEE